MLSEMILISKEKKNTETSVGFHFACLNRVRVPSRRCEMSCVRKNAEKTEILETKKRLKSQKDWRKK